MVSAGIEHETVKPGAADERRQTTAARQQLRIDLLRHFLGVRGVSEKQPGKPTDRLMMVAVECRYLFVQHPLLR